MSGAQRIHDPDLLSERAKHHGVGAYWIAVILIWNSLLTAVLDAFRNEDLTHQSVIIRKMIRNEAVVPLLFLIDGVRKSLTSFEI